MSTNAPVVHLPDTAEAALEALFSGSAYEPTTVAVRCDLCNKRLGVLGYLWGEVGQVVLIDIGMSVLLEEPFGATANWLPVETPGERGRRNRPYAVACPINGRWRFKAVCRGGRKNGRHQLREVTVTTATAEKAYRAAIEAGRSRITTYELETAGRRSRF